MSRLSAAKRQLIYSAASEAVMRARIELHKRGLSDANDDVLIEAQHRAGCWAIMAAEADARKAKSYVDLRLGDTRDVE